MGAGGIRTNPLGFKITTDGLKPLIDAGGTGGTGTANFSLKKAEFQLDPISNPGYGYPLFAPVRDTTAAYNGTTPITLGTTGVTWTGDSITLEYSLGENELPKESTYGRVYYRLIYVPFGDENKGSSWFIGNGLDITDLDKGVRTRGAGVLVKIGTPGKFVSTVNVPVGGF
jgi:hypothetical protein